MRLAYDMSAFMWRALLAGKDNEGRTVEHDGKTVHVNSCIYGYENVIPMMLSAMTKFGLNPIDTVLVFEGQHSKHKRQAIDPLYKASRDTRPPEAYEEFGKLRDLLDQTWRDMGAISMRQDFCEGDDVLAWLAENTEQDLIVATYDNDLSPLNGVNKYGATVQVWIDGIVGENNRGTWPVSLVRLYKTLCGKSGEMAGCVGFGPSAFNELLTKYGEDGAAEMLEMFESGTLSELHAIADQQKCKVLGKICSQEEHVLKQYLLAKLHPEWVDTLMHPLQVTPGKVKPQHALEFIDDRLTQWYGQAWLVTADNYNEIVPWAVSQFPASPFVSLDIETYTPPESDDWLAAQEDPDGVDVLASKLCGLGLTFGPNMQFTVYISVAHKDTNNCTSQQARAVVEMIPLDKPTVIQNLNFELPVLYQEWPDFRMDSGYEGFLPNCLDTKMEASYVNENVENGLKFRSLHHLGYKQQTFQETTQKSGPFKDGFEDCPAGGGPVPVKLSTLPPGGRQVKVYQHCVKAAVMGHEEGAVVGDPDRPVVEIEPAVYEEWETRQYKMNELTAAEVFGYGADDPICTAALHNFYRLMMELEHQWQVHLDTEIGAAYLTAAGFLQGTDISVPAINRLRDKDDLVKAAAWAKLRDWLMAQGWAGTVCPTFDWKSEAKEIKEAFEIVTGRKFDNRMRKIEKLLVHIREVEECPVLADLFEAAYAIKAAGPERDAAWQRVNDYVRAHFKGEPQINFDSPKQLQHLLYEKLGLPIVMRNKPTDQMKKAGIFEGNAKTDVLAMDWALKYDVKDKPEAKMVIEAVKLIKMVETRHELYYDKYPLFMHWIDGKVHSSVNQCQANTRRASEAKVNKQQLPKHEKIEGQPPEFRGAIVPHHERAVIVSMDFESQELVIIADESRDENMLACFIGDNKKKMHTLTALGIAKRLKPEVDWHYVMFEDLRTNPDKKKDPLTPSVKEAYFYGKKVNFTTEYGAMAEKVGQTLLISKEDAQAFIDAKEAAFPGARAWKESVIEEVKNTGRVRTKGGAVRHLRDALMSADAYERSKAERQGVNFKVQGTAAEQTKQTMGEAWKRKLIFKYDCVFIGPIHDELVWSVGIDCLHDFIAEAHACMVRPYGGMTVPITSSISFGPDFYHQIEIGNQPTREAVDFGLAELAKMKAELKEEVAA